MTPQDLLKTVEEAERAARIARGLPPAHLTDFTHFPFAFAMDAVGGFKRLMTDWQRHDPNSAGAAFYMAMAELAYRNYDKANAQMERCQAIAKDDGRERMRFGLTPSTPTFTMPSVVGEYPTHPALFLSCNEFYFNSFCMPLLASIADKSPTTAVHIHLMDNKPGPVGESLRRLPLNATLTHEDPYPLIEKLGIHPIGYFGAARLIRFSEALAHTKARLVMADVDALVTGDLAPLFDMPAPTAMRVRAGRVEPFHQYSACLLVGAEASRPYFQRVADILKADLPFAWWGMDQYALFSAAVALKPEISLLGPEITAVTSETPGLFWFTAGKAKGTLASDTTPYAALYRQYEQVIRRA